MKSLILSALIFLQSGSVLSDPDQEARAQNLMREIRCVACENEPISQSGSDIARDMRDRVREMVAEGRSNDEIRDWFVERYGEFVLFRPRSDGVSGWLLWGLPFAVLAVGGGWLLLARSRTEGETGDIAPIAPGEEHGER